MGQLSLGHLGRLPGGGDDVRIRLPIAGASGARVRGPAQATRGDEEAREGLSHLAASLKDKPVAREVAWLGGDGQDVLCQGLMLSSVTGRSWVGLEYGDRKSVV